MFIFQLTFSCSLLSLYMKSVVANLQVDFILVRSNWLIRLLSHVQLFVGLRLCACMTVLTTFRLELSVVLRGVQNSLKEMLASELYTCLL